MTSETSETVKHAVDIGSVGTVIATLAGRMDRKFDEQTNRIFQMLRDKQ